MRTRRPVCAKAPASTSTPCTDISRSQLHDGPRESRGMRPVMANATPRMCDRETNSPCRGDRPPTAFLTCFATEPGSSESNRGQASSATGCELQGATLRRTAAHGTRRRGAAHHLMWTPQSASSPRLHCANHVGCESAISRTHSSIHIRSDCRVPSAAMACARRESPITMFLSNATSGR